MVLIKVNFAKNIFSESGEAAEQIPENFPSYSGLCTISLQAVSGHFAPTPIFHFMCFISVNAH